MTIWQWFRDWRDKRSVLAEFNALQRADEASLRDNELNPIYMAKMSLDRGDPDTAAERWETARRLMPTIIYESDDSLPILLGLKRYEEAEAFVAEGRRRAPRVFRWRRDYAQIAEARRDFVEAARRWGDAQEGSDDPNEIINSILHEGICLRESGKLDEAEAVYEKVTRFEPNHFVVLVERARISEDRGDGEQCEARWRLLTEQYKVPMLYAGHAESLMRLHRIDEAETILNDAFIVYPGDLAIGVARCHVAEHRGDLEQAAERWARVQRFHPFLEYVYLNRARCLSGLGRHDDADAVLGEAIARFRRDEWPLREYAELAQRRQDWNEACLRWEAFRAKFPESETGYEAGRNALRAAGRDAEADALHRPI